ncbi:MAG: NAD(P)-dependent oxidoreductase [Candidatus Tectimicrobiota bacterium]
MKILCADPFPVSGREALQQAGCEVLYAPELHDEALTERLRTTAAEVLIVRSTRVTPAMLEARGLRLVLRAGSGYDTIDLAAASARGIYVANCPGQNAIAVAELTFGLLLALDRHIPDNVADLRRGQWNKRAYSQARGLWGRKLGLVGLGRVGREVCTRARAFGMPVLAWSRSLTPEGAAALGVEWQASPRTLAAAAEVVSVHVALTEQTRKLIDASVFAAMRPGTYFLNTARAEVVDQEALAQAVRERGIRAGLDVFYGEPASAVGTIDADIFQLPGVIGTHHIGASTEQAQEAIAAETVRIIQVYRETGQPPRVVNLAQLGAAGR